MTIFFGEGTRSPGENPHPGRTQDGGIPHFADFVRNDVVLFFWEREYSKWGIRE
jgi:hypothetical protein